MGARAQLTTQARSRIVDAACVAVLLIGSAIILFPLFWMAETAFKPPSEAYVMPPKFIFSPTLVNFRGAFAQQQGAGLAGYGTGYGRDLLHSLILLCASVAVALVLGTPAGYALSRSRSAGSRLIAGGLIVVYIAPALVYVLPLYVVYEKLDLLGSFVALTAFYETFELPFVTFMMRAFFSDISRELDDAARIDGCSRWQTFLKVVLPLVRPGLVTVTILTGVGSWGEYFGALIFSGPSTETAPVNLADFVGAGTSNWGALAAGSLLLVVPVLVVVVVLQRGYLRRFAAG
ncbi:MAG TPA: carbohydrate ABC transporter permease [Acidimicrobiales bacterium]|nr:carbohydrate ABC transporter permease [Acidimicrobiales bacterium]